MISSSQIQFQPPPTGSPTPLSALRSQHGGLPEAEARVADAVLADPALVTSESVSDLAARAGSSTATVVRMCRRIGFDGFYRFKIALAHEIGMNRQFGHPSLASTDSATVVQSALVADAQEIAVGDRGRLDLDRVHPERFGVMPRPRLLPRQRHEHENHACTRARESDRRRTPDAAMTR